MLPSEISNKFSFVYGGVRNYPPYTEYGGIRPTGERNYLVTSCSAGEFLNSPHKDKPLYGWVWDAFCRDSVVEIRRRDMPSNVAPEDEALYKTTVDLSTFGEVSDITLCFDQNMQFVIVFQLDWDYGAWKYYHYVESSGDFGVRDLDVTTTHIGAGLVLPYSADIPQSDIWFAYVDYAKRGSDEVNILVQRERYKNVHTLTAPYPVHRVEGFMLFDSRVVEPLVAFQVR